MIKVLYTHISGQREESNLASYLQKLPKALQNKIAKYRRWQDAYASLFGKLLLQAGLSVPGLEHYKLQDLKYSLHKRPYLEGNIDFNISHSGSYVVCVISDECRAGIDIEEIKEINLEKFRRYWTLKEWEKILHAPHQYDQFYDYWTKKEALVKAMGEGLYVPLRQIKLNNKFGLLWGKCWYFYALPIATGYCTHLAIDKEVNASIHIEEVVFPE